MLLLPSFLFLTSFSFPFSLLICTLKAFSREGKRETELTNYKTKFWFWVSLSLSVFLCPKRHFWTEMKKKLKIFFKRKKPFFLNSNFFSRIAMEFVGRTVKKDFKGFGVFSGTVRSYDVSSGLFKIVYDNSVSASVI